MGSPGQKLFSRLSSLKRFSRLSSPRIGCPAKQINAAKLAMGHHIVQIHGLNHIPEGVVSPFPVLELFRTPGQKELLFVFFFGGEKNKVNL